MPDTAPIRARKPSEDGFMLIAAMFLLFLLAISLTIAAPEIAKSIQRDREVETMERGKQYRRAIQLYYRKFNAYPPSIDALVKTSNIRFLRQRYIDPMTGKDDWKPITFGQNKAPLALGFFGQPLAGGGTPVAGTGPSGGNTTPGAGLGTGTGSSGAAGTFGSLFNSTNTGGTSSAGSTQSQAGGQGTGANGTSGQSGSSGTNGSTGTGSLSGQTGQTFGGGGIVGFEPAPAKQSILLYKKKDHYNEWEFTYSPLSEIKQVTTGGAPAGAQPAGSLNGQSGGATGSGFGGTGTGFGGTGSGFGNSPGGTSPTAPPTPPMSPGMPQ